MEHSTTHISSKIHSGGRLIIPSQIREMLHLDIGDTVIMQVDDGELRVMSQAEGIRRAQVLVEQYIPGDVSLSEDLIAERREQAAKELAELTESEREDFAS